MSRVVEAPHRSTQHSAVDREHDAGDPRAPPREALIEVCRRATAAGGRIPTATKTALFVTMKLEDLQNAIGALTTVGSLDGGALLAPETVRKLACDASIIPIVLGGVGEVWMRAALSGCSPRLS